MTVYLLTHFAKARLSLHRATPGFAAAGTITRRLEANATSVACQDDLTLEAFVPRGARAECGLLGFHFVRGAGSHVDVEVPYTEDDGDPWLDALGAQVDDVRLGLPREFALPLLDATAEFARRLPPGRLTVAEAAHGLVGSNNHFFRKIAACALSLMLDAREREQEKVPTFLSERLL